ncbi:DUF3800 domain-containing protein [Demequina sp. SYSU T00039]|uniref:DUF3800 domain-containing protein n=1 Tax=Demequina lignilytica TaxID=3051663 RepID=A0AAW7M3I1_9MICO|nr:MULTISPECIES: DUF3800 domain-containing protein [unclassified Demequina]MDN4478226.1 DUF3800 domain-containing protein [Demequina sp. SYSU T00039-1]MDN4488324.1 DUF3800 domain-containing protein [Demequina sp. SYSU T00039]MDN4490129.1 DUF3800 domain-containing protein [Demequina sp. SYSU T00068]
MLLFYVDESGGTSMSFTTPRHGRTRPQGSSDLFVLAAVGIHDSSRARLALELREAKYRCFGEGAMDRPWNDTELKGTFLAHVVRHRDGERMGRLPAGYSALLARDKVDELLHNLGQIFAKFRPLVFATVVDKLAMVEREDTSTVIGAAYSRLYERVALTLDQVNEGEGGLFVADQQDEHEAYFRSGAMKGDLDGLAARRSTKPNFRLLIDKPVWIDSSLSTWDRELIQLPDLVAYATYEWYKVGGPPQGANFLWDKIEPCFAEHWNTTKVQRGGIIVHPDPGRYPPVA